MSEYVCAKGIRMWGSSLFQDAAMVEDVACALLTGAEKNMVVQGTQDTDKIMIKGKMDNSIDHTYDSANIVYDPEGISPTVTTCQGGGIQPKVLVGEQIPISTQGDDLDVAKTLLAGYERTNMTGFNNDNAVLVKHQQDNIQTEDGVSRALVAGTHGNADIFTKTAVKVTPDVKHQQDNIMTEDDICMTQCAGLSGRYNVLTDYAIRKLTPKECFRLMGVHDEDYEKLTVSNTQKYKQAGNSIVVDCLMAIFENMFIKECKSNSLF